MVGCAGHHTVRIRPPTGFCFAALEQFEHLHVPPLDGPDSLIPGRKPTCKVVELMEVGQKAGSPEVCPGHLSDILHVITSSFKCQLAYVTCGSESNKVVDVFRWASPL